MTRSSFSAPAWDWQIKGEAVDGHRFAAYAGFPAPCVTCISARVRGSGEDGYQVRGLPQVELLFQAAGQAGQAGQAGPELYGPSRRWTSLTPYLPVRHHKRESLEDYLAADVRTELGYRDLPPAAITPVASEPGLPTDRRWGSGGTG